MKKLPREATQETAPDVRDLIAAVSCVREWQDGAIEYEKVTGGITNENFKVSVDGASFFVKIPGAGTDAFIDQIGRAHV